MIRAEALARWTSPEFGSVPPDRFIAVAERAGLIAELGRRILRRICDDLKDYPELLVSINISPLQLMAPDFVGMLVRELREKNIEPARVEVEMTEAILVDNPDLVSQRLQELRSAGFTTALDDFGTGYSSIGYLEQLKFNVLKIDKSFVKDLDTSSKRLTVVQSMICMAHAMDLHVVCEGVEYAEQLDLLRSAGCDFIQGYHFDQPLPLSALVVRWLKAADGSFMHLAPTGVSRWGDNGLGQQPELRRSA
jgi:EAL domain-containing protein (putative c-di-GMP-specific phosphodiesterase class I)